MYVFHFRVAYSGTVRMIPINSSWLNSMTVKKVTGEYCQAHVIRYREDMYISKIYIHTYYMHVTVSLHINKYLYRVIYTKNICIHHVLFYISLNAFFQKDVLKGSYLFFTQFKPVCRHKRPTYQFGRICQVRPPGLWITSKPPVAL